MPVITKLTSVKQEPVRSYPLLKRSVASGHIYLMTEPAKGVRIYEDLYHDNNAITPIGTHLSHLDEIDLRPFIGTVTLTGE